MLSISAPGRKKYWIACVVDDHFGHPLLPGTKGTICLLDGKDSAQWGGPVSFPSRPCCWQSLGCCSLKDNDGKPGSVLTLPFPGDHGDGEHWEDSWADPGGQLDCAWASESPNSKVKGDIQRFLVLCISAPRHGEGRRETAFCQRELGTRAPAIWVVNALSSSLSLSFLLCMCAYTPVSVYLCLYVCMCLCMYLCVSLCLCVLCVCPCLSVCVCL